MKPPSLQCAPWKLLWIAGATIAILLPAAGSNGGMQRSPDARLFQAGGLALTGTVRASGLCFNPARGSRQSSSERGALGPANLWCPGETGAKVAGRRTDDTLGGCRGAGNVLGAVRGSFKHCVHLGSEDPRRTLVRVRGGGQDAGADFVAGVVDVGAHYPANPGGERPRRTNVQRRLSTSHGKESPRRSR